MPRLAEFPLETGAAAPREDRMWRYNGGPPCIFQAFPNPGCFAPSFSKQIFGRFVGFQGVASLPNRKCGLSKSFVARRPLSASFWTPPDHIPPSHAVAVCGRTAAYGEVGQGARSWAEQRSGSREF